MSKKREAGGQRRQFVDMTSPFFPLERQAVASRPKNDYFLESRCRIQEGRNDENMTFCEEECCVYRSFDLTRQRLERMTRPPSLSASGTSNIQEEIAQRQHNLGNCVPTCTGLSSPGSFEYFLRHGVLPFCESSTEREGQRLHELRLIRETSPSACDRVKRGGTGLVGTRHYRDEEMRRPYVEEELQRFKILHRENQEADMELQYVGRCDEGVIDLQPRTLPVTASEILDRDHGIVFETTESTQLVRGIYKNRVLSGSLEHAGATESTDNTPFMFRRLTAYPPLFASVSSHFAGTVLAETYSQLQTQPMIDASLLEARRAVSKSAQDTLCTGFCNSTRQRQSSLHEGAKDQEIWERLSTLQTIRQTDKRRAEIRAGEWHSLLGNRTAAGDCDHFNEQYPVEYTCNIENHQSSASGTAHSGGLPRVDGTGRHADHHLLTRNVQRKLTHHSLTNVKGASSRALPLGTCVAGSLCLPSDDPMDSLSSLMEQYSAGGTKEAPFPLKLHAILANPEYQDIIGWLPDGKAWKIFQVYLFEENIVPRHFRHAKCASFMRQVNGWGFRRRSHQSPGEYNSYIHSLFVRDDPKKCLKMIRSGAERNVAGEQVVTKDERGVKRKRRNSTRADASYVSDEEDGSL